MRFATTDQLLTLNDEAIVNDLPEWLRRRFLDELADPGRHLLSDAIQHQSSDGQPRFWRTLWYGERTDGSTVLFTLDILERSFALLPHLAGTSVEDLCARHGVPTMPPIVLVGEQSFPLEGRAILTAIVKRNAPLTLPVARVDALTSGEISTWRAAVRNA